MLNINKIESLINSGENNPAIVSRGTGIKYQTFISKIKSGSWTPDDVERIADFFNKPLEYFFDKESNSVKKDLDKNPEVKGDEDELCNHPTCVAQRKKLSEEIDSLKEQLKDKNELLEFYRGKKETGNGNNPQSSESANRSKAS